LLVDFEGWLEEMLLDLIGGHEGGLAVGAVDEGFDFLVFASLEGFS